MNTLWKSIKITLAFCILLAVCYVFVLWIVAQVSTPRGGNFETVEVNGKIVGAANVGQAFTDSTYFWGRPSAVDYDGASSGGSNKATTNPEYLADVETRVKAFLAAHPYLTRKEVPSEMVTASGSGLDPHISPASAQVQIKRVAQMRGVPEQAVKAVVDSITEKPLLGMFGTPKVNVLKLNVALSHLKAQS